MAGLSIPPGRAAAEPNVIPMIDILLVLLIIFMLTGIRQVIPVQVPPPATRSATSLHPIVLELLPSGGYAINRHPIADSLLERALGDIYETRPTKLLFVKAAPDRSYQEVVEAFDRARAAGVQALALVP